MSITQKNDAYKTTKVKLEQTGLWVVLVLVSCLVCPPAFGQVSLDASRIGDATHLEFSGLGEWKYELKRESENSQTVLLRVKDLGPEAIAKLKSHKDSLITSISVVEKGLDGAAEVSFQLAPGADFFDYLSEQPSRLIVDFFPKDLPEATRAKKEEPSRAKAESVVSKAMPKELPPRRESPKVQAGTDGRLKGKFKELDDGDDTESGDDDRQPAGTDFVLVAKGQLPTARSKTDSIAEKISAEKDFRHGIFDGGDPEFRRFGIKDYEISESAIIASRANFYLSFPALEPESPHLKALIAATPTYEIVPNETRENKEARILLNLFSSGKKAVFLKSAKEFIQAHPKSPYDEIVRYMMADTHFEFWRKEGSLQDFETAMSQYLLLSEKYPDSAITPRTLLLMGYSHLDRGDSFSALKAFQSFNRVSPDSKHADKVKVAVAESYLKLNRFEDAYALLDQLEKSAKKIKMRQEAAFRKGDVFFKKKDYAAAVEQHKSAIARFPEAAERFPNAWYNIAEAEFSRSRYREGLEAYRQFLQKFPDHPHGGYAMTRMGELLGILGANPRRAQGAFLESFFRYRSTPGAGIARIRNLTNRMPDMKAKELNAALREIASITEKYSVKPIEEKSKEKENAQETHGADGEADQSEDNLIVLRTNPLETAEPEDPTQRPLELAGIEEFSSLLIADGFTSRQEYDKAAADLIAYYQKYPQSANAGKFKTRIVNNLAEGIRTSVEKGDFIDALRRFSGNSDGWLKNSDRVDIGFYVGRAYEQAGVFGEAQRVYRDSLKRLADIRAGAQEKEHSVFERLPKVDAVHLRLAAVTAKEKNFVEAESHLKNISSDSNLSEPEQIERAEISADVAEARGQSELARKYLVNLIQTWKGQPSLTSPLHLRVARLMARVRKFQEADAHLAKIAELAKQEGSVNSDVHAEALQLRGDLFLSRGMRRQAVETFQSLLQSYEKQRPLESVRYQMGKILYDDGDLKGAEVAWAEIKSDGENLWRKLANEQMESAKWRNEYKKYINRIPAAADLREADGSKTQEDKR